MKFGGRGGGIKEDEKHVWAFFLRKKLSFFRVYTLSFEYNSGFVAIFLQVFSVPLNAR